MLKAITKKEDKNSICKIFVKNYYQKEIDCVKKVYKENKIYINTRNSFAIAFKILKKLNQ